jgi:GNAT superfamily N-acetyltransferase
MASDAHDRPGDSSSEGAAFEVTAAGPGDADDLVALFHAAGSPCFCRFWHFTGTNNEWLDRCANAVGENERALREALAAGSDEARGVVARVRPEGAARALAAESASAARALAAESAGAAAGALAAESAGAAAGAIVGWMKVAPVAVMRKAYDRRLYRNLPCFAGDRSGVFAIGCFLVHPDHRKRGVSEALVRGAVAIAPSWGARALEAFPRRPKEPVRDDELWTGPMSAFERNGFVEVHTFEPYPVLRRDL